MAACSIAQLQPKTMGVVIYPGFEMLDVAGPLEYFNSVSFQVPLKVVMISQTGEPTGTYISRHPLPLPDGSIIEMDMDKLGWSGQAFVSNYSYANAPKLDYILVPGGMGGYAEIYNEELLKFLRKKADEVEYFLTVCTGSTLAAKAGLLNGHKATSNKAAWYFVTSPLVSPPGAVEWIPRARWVEDGKFITSSGVQAGMDMSHYFIKKIYGAALAEAVAAGMEYAPHEDPNWDPFAELNGLVNATTTTAPGCPATPTPVTVTVSVPVTVTVTPGQTTRTSSTRTSTITTRITTTTTRTTTRSTPTHTPPASLWAQCGGRGWKGPTTCARGTCNLPSDKPGGRNALHFRFYFHILCKAPKRRQHILAGALASDTRKPQRGQILPPLDRSPTSTKVTKLINIRSDPAPKHPDFFRKQRWRLSSGFLDSESWKPSSDTEKPLRPGLPRCKTNPLPSRTALSNHLKPIVQRPVFASPAAVGSAIMESLRASNSSTPLSEIRKPPSLPVSRAESPASLESLSSSSISSKPLPAPIITPRPISARARLGPTGTGTRALADVDSSITGSTDLSGGKKERIQHHKINDSEDVEAHYTMGKKLGQGSFGTVHTLQHKETLKLYACKIVKKKRGSPLLYDQLQREIAIMKKVNHPHIVQLYEVYETPRKYFLVMEYAITYLHDHGVVHRDLKVSSQLSSLPDFAIFNQTDPSDLLTQPENILISLTDPIDNYIIKVSDFGLATFADACNMMENIVGTPLYMAPEIVQNLGYSATCDVWSIGVMMYLMLLGYSREIETQLGQMIANGKVEFPEEWWKEVSVGGSFCRVFLERNAEGIDEASGFGKARALCEATLKFDPAKRITAREMQMHPWMLGTTHHSPTTPTTTNVLDLMRSYNAERRLRVVLLTVRAAIRVSHPNTHHKPPSRPRKPSKQPSTTDIESASSHPITTTSQDSLCANADESTEWSTRAITRIKAAPRARSAVS
ncbi:Serine/threonine-protein kinase 33, partial [Rhizophlyctis rosea]